MLLTWKSGALPFSSRGESLTHPNEIFVIMILVVVETS